MEAQAQAQMEPKNVLAGGQAFWGSPMARSGMREDGGAGQDCSGQREGGRRCKPRDKGFGARTSQRGGRHGKSRVGTQEESGANQNPGEATHRGHRGVAGLRCRHVIGCHLGGA